MNEVLWHLLAMLDVEAVGVDGLMARYSTAQLQEILHCLRPQNMFLIRNIKGKRALAATVEAAIYVDARRKAA